MSNSSWDYSTYTTETSEGLSQQYYTQQPNGYEDSEAQHAIRAALYEGLQNQNPSYDTNLSNPRANLPINSALDAQDSSQYAISQQHSYSAQPSPTIDPLGHLYDSYVGSTVVSNYQLYGGISSPPVADLTIPSFSAPAADVVQTLAPYTSTDFSGTGTSIYAAGTTETEFSSEPPLTRGGWYIHPPADSVVPTASKFDVGEKVWYKIPATEQATEQTIIVIVQSKNYDVGGWKYNIQYIGGSWTENAVEEEKLSLY